MGDWVIWVGSCELSFSATCERASDVDGELEGCEGVAGLARSDVCFVAGACEPLLSTVFCFEWLVESTGSTGWETLLSGVTSMVGCD